MRNNAKVRAYFKNPIHAGVLSNSQDVRTVTVGSLEQGAVLRLQIQLDNELRVHKARFKAYGCAATIAVAEYVSIWAEGKRLEQLAELNSHDITQALALPSVKVHSSILAVQALRALSVAQANVAAIEV